jgi:hypothetical protein
VRLGALNLPIRSTHFHARGSISRDRPPPSSALRRLFAAPNDSPNDPIRSDPIERSSRLTRIRESLRAIARWDNACYGGKAAAPALRNERDHETRANTRQHHRRLSDVPRVAFNSPSTYSAINDPHHIVRDCGLCRAFGLELGFSDSRARRTADLYTLHSEQMYDAYGHNA